MFIWSACSQILDTLYSDVAASLIRSDAYRATFGIICSILRLLALLKTWEKTTKLILYPNSILYWDYSYCCIELNKILDQRQCTFWSVPTVARFWSASRHRYTNMPQACMRHHDYWITKGIPSRRTFLKSLRFGTDSNLLWFH